MTEDELLSKMVAPAGARPNKPYRGGVIQILVTSSCDKACYCCTQASNLARDRWSMSPEHFEQAVRSLGFGNTAILTTSLEKDGPSLTSEVPVPAKDAYFGVVGLFGGNPALSPHFDEYCKILKRLVPKNQRGIWCNNPITEDRAAKMRETFDPSISNLNVHLDRHAYEKFKKGWPEAHVVGLETDSRHSPVFVAMKDVVRKGALQEGEMGLEHSSVPDDDRIRELISTCDINQNWSAMIGVFRGELRAWFCEVAGAQAILHQNEPDYPDTGLDPTKWYQYASDKVYSDPSDVSTGAIRWWQRQMHHFKDQVRKHCFDCGVPLRGYGELSQAADGVEQTSKTHIGVFVPKRQGRPVEVVTELVQLGVGKLAVTTHYLQNSKV